MRPCRRPWSVHATMELHTPVGGQACATAAQANRWAAAWNLLLGRVVPSMVSGMTACVTPWSRHRGPPTRAPSPERLAGRPEVDRQRPPTALSVGAGVGRRCRSGGTSCATIRLPGKLPTDQRSTKGSLSGATPPTPWSHATSRRGPAPAKFAEISVGGRLQRHLPRMAAVANTLPPPMHACCSLIRRSR